MDRLRKMIRETIEQGLNSVPANALTSEYLSRRIPFLKEFRMSHNEPGLISYGKDEYNTNVTKTSADLEYTMKLKHLNFFSNFTYNVQNIGDQTIHKFSIENEILLIPDKDPEKEEAVQSIVSSMIQMMTKKLNDDNSAEYQIIEVDGSLPKEELDKVIGLMNEKLYKFGAHITKYFDSEFLVVK